MPSFIVSEEEKYFFDLRGYLIVRGALSQSDLDECNRAIEHFADRIKPIEGRSLARGSKALEADEGRMQLTGMLGWPAPWREPFRRLLVHPVVVSRLNEFCGKRFRLDHGPLMIGAHKGTEGHRLHGAGEPFSPSVAYHQQNGKIICRGITVAWQLHDVNEGDGGFAIVPGSHKSCEPGPEGVRSVEDSMGLVVQPSMKAGDVLFFAETATHGTLPWKGEKERRSVLYKFASRGAARAVGRHFTPESRYGEWVYEMTDAQRAVLYGPGHHTGGVGGYVLESDGEKVWVKE
ncbi:MAG: phytanoyl-CoA dioxygenase family protein [Planctomycetota bacterium]|jgi:hypothetical protein|nr:phytanoyl-CoA dioxygenase family protein [Planctomycetota bacterium]MDP6504090.1 phytanoyl-CoA dioxygenase family protein [Planctomycetota bacterium]